MGHDGTMWEAERLMFQTNPIQTKQIGHHLEVSQNRATPSSSRHGRPSLSIETTVTTGDPPAIRKLNKPQWLQVFDRRTSFRQARIVKMRPTQQSM